MSITPEVTFIPEWAEQDLVLLSWPNADMDWASRLPEIEVCYRGIAEAILEWEDLLILAKDNEHVRHVSISSSSSRWSAMIPGVVTMLPYRSTTTKPMVRCAH